MQLAGYPKAVSAACGCTGNMMLFDQHGKIKRYESPEAILVEFFQLRMDYYARRRALLIQAGLALCLDNSCMSAGQVLHLERLRILHGVQVLSCRQGRLYSAYSTDSLFALLRRSYRRIQARLVCKKALCEPGHHFAATMQVAQFELNKLSNRVRFILAVISGDLVVSNRRRAAIEADLTDQGFERMPNTKKVLHTAAALFPANPDLQPMLAVPPDHAIHHCAAFLDCEPST